MKTVAIVLSWCLAAPSTLPLGSSDDFLQPEGDVPAAPTSEPAVDTSELGDLGMLITPRVIDATAPVLAEAGMEPSMASIRITFLNAENFEYAIRVVLDPSKSLDNAPVLKTCRGCMTDQLVEATMEAVRKAIERKEARELKMPDPEPEPEPEQPAPPADDSPRDTGPTPSRGLGPMGWGGVAALAVGVASVATGGAFLGLGERRPADDKSQFRDFRPSGYGLLGVGGALVITGVALIVVDRVRAKRRSGRSAVVAPVLAPDSAGFAISGRF
jgi:hypothetical protein